MKDLNHKLTVEKKKKTFKVTIAINYRGHETRASYEGMSLDEIGNSWKIASNDALKEWLIDNYGKKSGKKIYKSIMKDWNM